MACRQALVPEPRTPPTSFPDTVPSTRRRPPLLLLAILAALLVWSLVRFGLWLSLGDARPDAPLTGAALLLGIAFDLATLAFIAAPALLIAALWPNRWASGRLALLLRWCVLGTVLFTLGFGAISEVVFWQEFTTRFNFIAVDYLIYTQEVVNNIRQSYPVGTILGALAAVVASVVILLARRLDLSAHPVTWRQRALLALSGAVLPPTAFALFSVDMMEFSANQYANELAGNGLFSLAAAMRRNELDYERYYRTIPQPRADQLLSSLGANRLQLADAFAAVETVPRTVELGPFKRSPRHLILISVESLSAEFLGVYGNSQGLTPHLDELASQGLRFDWMFATGTRTVRGLEALSLGVPPVPGQSIVRRPNNEQLASLGEVLEDNGFKNFFLYGGYGYFDNMNAFFGANDYTVIDRTDFKKDSIVFENVWGVADESLYSNTLTTVDASVRAGNRVFAHVMTTSNHRPFTYPGGRIDIPSPGGREGAVKYTDYAIGKFIADARQKDWFKDTLFVIVADHCASSAGKSKLPVEKYRIAALFYAPDMLEPGVYERRASQIDLVPTLIDVLGAKGDEHFFGQSLFEEKHRPPRAFISNYQELGYYRDDRLVILSPRQRVATFAVDPATLAATPTANDDALTEEAIAYYQTASKAFKSGALRYTERAYTTR